MKRYRAVLWDYPEGQPGGGGPESTLSYDQLPKTEWFYASEAAYEAGEKLRRQGGGSDFYIRIEEEEIEKEPKAKITKSYFLIWEDWQDNQSHGKIIHVPEGKNPEVFADDYLSNYGELGKYGFLIESVEEIKEEKKHIEW